MLIRANFTKRSTGCQSIICKEDVCNFEAPFCSDYICYTKSFNESKPFLCLSEFLLKFWKLKL